MSLGFFTFSFSSSIVLNITHLAFIWSWFLYSESYGLMFPFFAKGWPLYLCQKSIVHMCMGPFLNFLVYSIDLFCVFFYKIPTVFFFFFLRAAPTAYGGSQALAYATATAMPYLSHDCNIGSLTCWARPGIEPESSWMLVRFVSSEPGQELPFHAVFIALALWKVLQSGSTGL